MNELEQKIINFFDREAIDSFKELNITIQHIEQFGKRIWIASAVGAVAKAIELCASSHFTKKVIEAHNTLKIWVEEPTEQNALLAEEKYFPYKQLFNCNDILDRTNRATSFTINALKEKDDESFKLAKSAMISMCHPFVLDEKRVWDGIKKSVLNIIKEK